MSTDLAGSVTIVAAVGIFVLSAIVSVGEIFIALNSPIDLRMCKPQTIAKSGESSLIIELILPTTLCASTNED